MIRYFLLLSVCLCGMALYAARGVAASGEKSDGEGWVVMPAGARPAYMGIHGGTMPVSLLVYEGTSLITFVGRTGNDFLEVLRRTDLPMPSLLNATSQRGGGPAALHAGALTTGGPTASMPVFNVTGEKLSGLETAPGQLQPFGFSDKPLSIEGEVTRPQHLSPAKQYRLLLQPQYLQPRRNPR